MKDKNISGRADPVIKTTGKSIIKKENKRTSKDIDSSLNKDLKGSMMKLIIIFKSYTFKFYY